MSHSENIGPGTESKIECTIVLLVPADRDSFIYTIIMAVSKSRNIKRPSTEEA